MSRRYHHGDLPTAIVEGGLAVLAEHGLAGFSVAAIARRIGVSTAAPYRHFPDRDHLLAAVATRLGTDLAAALAAAVDGAGADPADRLAAGAGAYVEFVARRRVGFDVLFAPELRPLSDRDLAAAGRAVMDVLLAPARALTPEAAGALVLLERILVLAHGYASMDGFLAADRVADEATSVRATRAAAALIRGGVP